MHRIEEPLEGLILLLDYVEAYLTGVWAEVADEDFSKDLTLTRKLEDIGRLCRRVPERVRELYPHIDWEAVENLGETEDLEIEEVEETTGFAQETTLKDRLIGMLREIRQSHTLN